MSLPPVILYTRAGCHLCDEAFATLQRHGCTVDCVDIDQHSEWLAAYDHEVPVVEIAGQVRFRGRVDELLLRRLLLAQQGK
jgi:glutaredoxin